MYEDYYGLIEKPFSLTPDPKYLFKSGSHADALEQLRYGVRRRDGFVVITGDTGTGKTTLCRAVLDQFDERTFTSLVLNPFVSEEDLLRLILQDFGVVSRDQIKRGRLAAISKQELIATLNDFLLSLLPLRAGAVLIVDEAQNLPLQVLEQIRILSNLETDKEKLLQIVLVGQPSLTDLVRSPELCQLDQRVSIRCDLKPLSREETGAYITHRLAIANGGIAGGVTFAPRAMNAVFRSSGGIPRLINLLCDRALLAGCAEQATGIQRSHVRQAAESLDLGSPRHHALGWLRQRAAAFAAGAGVVGMLVAGPALLTGPRAAGAPPSRTAATRADVTLPPVGARTVAATSGQALPPARLDGTGARTKSDPAAHAGEPTRPYSVLVASFRTRPEADSLVADLEIQGYTARISRAFSATTGRWMQVLAGPFGDLAEARAAERQLRQAPAYADAHVTRR